MVEGFASGIKTWQALTVVTGENGACITAWTARGGGGWGVGGWKGGGCYCVRGNRPQPVTIGGSCLSCQNLQSLSRSV